MMSKHILAIIENGAETYTTPTFVNVVGILKYDIHVYDSARNPHVLAKGTYIARAYYSSHLKRYMFDTENGTFMCADISIIAKL